MLHTAKSNLIKATSKVHVHLLVLELNAAMELTCFVATCRVLAEVCIEEVKAYTLSHALLFPGSFVQNS